jgi:glycosyltransferase involved in cell wall biosynthesis
MPLVSVVMPSFNHADFVKKAIESVLQQTVTDLELIVVDDGSADASNSQIRSVQDSRIRHIPLVENVGASEATNIGIRASRGRYIAICNSDDLWVETKLETQVSVLDACMDISAVFSDVSWINDDGEHLTKSQMPWYHNVFRRPTPSRPELLRLLVEEGNFLCHPSLLIRRDVYESLGLYNNALRQLPDMDMWVRFAQSHALHILPDRLVKFRIHQNNTSGDGSDKQARTWAEHELICRAFFKALNSSIFYESFGASSVRNSVSQDEKIFKAELLNYLLSYNGAFKKIFEQIALELCYDYSRRGDQELIPAAQIHALSMKVGLAALGRTAETATPTPKQGLLKESRLSMAFQNLVAKAKSFRLQ